MDVELVEKLENTSGTEAMYDVLPTGSMEVPTISVVTAWASKEHSSAEDA